MSALGRMAKVVSELAAELTSLVSIRLADEDVAFCGYQVRLVALKNRETHRVRKWDTHAPSKKLLSG